MTEKLAVFDLDGTLYDGQIWKALVNYQLKHNVNRGAAVAYLARNVSRYMLYKAKVLARDVVWEKFGYEIMLMLKGMSRDATTQAAQGIYHTNIAPHLDQDLINSWEDFGRQGYRRLILSGSPLPIAEEVGKALQADAVLATNVEFRAGKYTGAIVGGLCQGKEKAKKLLAYTADQGWAVDWRASHAFGDSYTDLPILSLVGTPHVVRPDPKLYHHAQMKGWRVWGSPALV